ncbi:MAG: endonuclease MutS2 [Spirochaetales bacterium]|nr:endonuclease MutS2 [Spirochaetales bacterium]
MNKHTLSLLSFQAVIDELKGYTAGEEAKKLLDELVFHTEKDQADADLSCTTAVRKMMDASMVLPAFDLPEIAPALKLLPKQGTVLDAHDFGGLLRTLLCCTSVKRFLSQDDTPDVLRAMADKLPLPKTLSKDIGALVDRDGEIQYSKIPSLAKLQQLVKKARSSIEKRASAYINNPDFSEYFQTDVATLKDGRTVLPLKAQYKGRIKGIIHEVSSTGQTLFLEPADIVDMNNDLVVQENALRGEIHRLLRELTESTRQYCHELALINTQMAEIDVVFSKAKYSRVHKCQPALSSKTDVVLKNARHPLLGRDAVPLNYSLDSATSILLVTGPNTGGKTVTVKTLGILAAMNQFGMEIPADEGTTLPLFDDIFADIGDEQSIEQSLSTFQAHMKNIAFICTHAGPLSLVLLDELGAGTDPEEGTAIAMALLDHFLSKKTKVLATTHHGILKNYGYMKTGVMNASMEFDAEKLAPTYKVIMGIPGESHALTIAGRTGVPDGIISAARDYLTEERTDISRLIDELSREKRKLLEQEQQQREKELATREIFRDISLKEILLRQRERELREHGLADISTFLKDSRKTLERIIKEIREGAKQEAIDEGRKLLGMIEAKAEKETQRIAELEDISQDKEDTQIREGCHVRVHSTGQEGTVIRKTRNNQFIIGTGSMKVTLSEKDFSILPHKTKDKNITVEIVTPHSGSMAPAAFELNVMGFRLADAMRALEKQMDAVLVQGIAEFTILHGKGTGTLQHAIHEYLAQLPFVETFHFARPEFGGSGKTVVILRK